MLQGQTLTFIVASSTRFHPWCSMELFFYSWCWKKKQTRLAGRKSHLMPNWQFFLSDFSDSDGQKWKQSWQAADRLVSARQKLCQINPKVRMASQWPNVSFSLFSVNLTGWTAATHRQRKMSGSNRHQHTPNRCEMHNFPGDTHTHTQLSTAQWCAQQA